MFTFVIDSDPIDELSEIYECLKAYSPESAEVLFQSLLLAKYKNDHRKKAEHVFKEINKIKGHLKYEENFNKVLKELIEFKEKDTKEKLQEIKRLNDIINDKLVNGNLRPFDVSNTPLVFFHDSFLFGIPQEEEPDCSWSYNEALREYQPRFAYREKEPTEFRYEKGLDAHSSLLYAIDRLVSSSNGSFSLCEDSRRLRKIIPDVINALASSVNKLSTELSESYLRGAKSQRIKHENMYR